MPDLHKVLPSKVDGQSRKTPSPGPPTRRLGKPGDHTALRYRAAAEDDRPKVATGDDPDAIAAGSTASTG